VLLFCGDNNNSYGDLTRGDETLTPIVSEAVFITSDVSLLAATFSLDLLLPILFEVFVPAS
jgi:hypothetical protein